MRAPSRRGSQRRLWIFSLALVALTAAASTATRLASAELCRVCASRRSSIRWTALFGLIGTESHSDAADSALVLDGVVSRIHEHRWAMIDGSSRWLWGEGVHHGGDFPPRLACDYAWRPKFRDAVRTGIADGRFTLDDLRGALDHAPKTAGEESIVALQQRFDADLIAERSAR